MRYDDGATKKRAGTKRSEEEIPSQRTKKRRRKT